MAPDLGSPSATYVAGKRTVHSRYVDAAMPHNIYDALCRIVTDYKTRFSENLSISIIKGLRTGNIGIAAHSHNIGIKFYGNYTRLFESSDMTAKDEFILDEFIQAFGVSKSIRSNRTAMRDIEEAVAKAESRLSPQVIKFMEELVKDF